MRPNDVHSHALTVPNVGAEGVSIHNKLLRPTLSVQTLYTAQPVKKAPGHTGFITFATLSHKHY